MTIVKFDVLSNKKVSFGISFSSHELLEMQNQPGTFYPAGLLTIGLIFVSINVIKPKIKFID